GDVNEVSLLPVELKVDYDRDGEDDILGDPSDNVPTGMRYRFWTNIDNDEGDDAEAEDQLINYQVIPNNSSDSTDNTIDCLRDLEDFTRLSLGLNGLANLSNIEIGLKFVDASDPNSPPSIRVFLSADEEHGTDDYLFQMDAANAQVNGQSIHSIGLVTVSSQSAWFPEGTLDHVSSTKRLHMIFEGVAPGSGTLAVEIKTPDGVISTIPCIPMEIKPVREMYEHWTALDTEEVNIEDIPATATKAADSGTFDPNGPETDDAIVFVHGWRMKLRDRRDYADTSFKRLWHAGFAGKFYNFSWPTEYTERVIWLPGDPPADLANYAKSEEKAYVSGRGALKDFLTNRIQVPPSEIRIFSHSMGGIVVSEALLAGATVHTFASCQSAMAAHAYGRPASGAVDRAHPPFINWETDEVYANYPPTALPYYDSIRSVIYNFYNEDDSALDSWRHGQNLKPNDCEGGSPSEHYGYNKPATQFFFNDGTTYRALNFPDNVYEIFAHGAEAQSYALGAVSHPSISRNFNLNADFSASEERFGEDHSAQFRGTNMIRYPFWRQLIGPACFASSVTRTNP
ncbi:MAG: alpha/beta hydrolase, partial [Verrucomicrobiae bacterium]|nr:alpha/beta hydrolase [Verrucomicrobiae bacterium]